MSNFITTHDQWLEEYRKDKYKVWIRATLSNGTEYYLPNHDQWVALQSVCKDQQLNVLKLGLQYRSHFVEVDTSDCDGVYLIRSLIGVMGENSKQSITIGKVYGDTVKKTMWVTPELIAELTSEDKIEDCFKEALILHYDKEKTKTGTI
jgi:hypothetical protein